jgi:menaquinone-dependent protoporphyrinogen oxidase
MTGVTSRTDGSPREGAPDADRGDRGHEEDPVDVAAILAATKARDHRVFAGKLVREHLRFPDKAIVAALRVPEGDYRDWTEIRSWASGIAAILGSGS